MTNLNVNTPIDLWICQHYNELCDGISCSLAANMKPNDVKTRVFQLQLKDKCERIRVQIKHERYYAYRLKDEYKTLYKQTERVN